jgi:hypothetical protein
MPPPDLKPGLFPAEPGRAIQRAQAVRQIADYEATPVPLSEAGGTVRSAAEFVAAAAALVAGPERQRIDPPPAG